MATLDGPTKEEIKNRIDKSKDNFVDSNELTNFIFDEKEWAKNLTDLWNYLNKLNFHNFDEIKSAINNYFKSPERINNYNKKISEKIMNNDPLNKKELSLIYLKMASEWRFTWYPLSVESNSAFDADKPIDKICNWTLISYIRNEYKKFGYLPTNSSNKLDKTKSNTWSSKEKQSNIRKATEKEKNSFFSVVKKYASEWYELLVRWKDYIVKKTSWALETVWELVWGIVRTFVDFTKIVSAPSYSEIRTNKRTGKKSKMTFCSKTAQENANNFWVKIPRGNAKDWVHNPIEDKEHFVRTITKSWNNNSYIDINVTAPDTANFADISVISPTRNWKKYWHRLTAFKTNDGQRYVLDPYFSWWNNTKPIPREKYRLHTVAEQINFYNAPKQSRSAT